MNPSIIANVTTQDINGQITKKLMMIGTVAQIRVVLQKDMKSLYEKNAMSKNKLMKWSINMKKFLTTIMLIILCGSAVAGDLPFVGKREFNFDDGNANNLIIHIQKTGKTTIYYSYMPTNGFGSMDRKIKHCYKGSYNQIMRCNGEYYKFSEIQAFRTNKNGRVLKNCYYPTGIQGALCAVELYKL